MVSIKLYAGTDIGLRDNNEDNFIVCPDLLSDSWTVPHTESAIPLGERGCLLVVSDGMGGQNAGEVASAITVETVREKFSPVALSDKVLSSSTAIRNYMSTVIKEADDRVKKHGTTHPDAEGLGATIVMAWVVGRKAYVAWMGDSRVYSLLPEQGIIRRLSKDHSYVQQLVDAGKLTDEEAMVHPNSNIITRSIGDTYQKPKPDTMEHDLQDGEMLLLCSDGLCGVCTDAEILNIVRTCGPDDLRRCKTALANAALEAGGSDNITVVLLRVRTDNDDVAARRDTPATGRNEYVKTVIPERNNPRQLEHNTENTDNKKMQLSLLVFSVLAVIAAVAVVTMTVKCSGEKCGGEKKARTADAVGVSAVDTARTFSVMTAKGERSKYGDIRGKKDDSILTSNLAVKQSYSEFKGGGEETMEATFLPLPPVFHSVQDAITLKIGENKRVTLLKASGNHGSGPELTCTDMQHVKIGGGYACTNSDVTTFSYDITLSNDFRGPATISYGNIKIKIKTISKVE